MVIVDVDVDVTVNDPTATRTGSVDFLNRVAGGRHSREAEETAAAADCRIAETGDRTPLRPRC